MRLFTGSFRALEEHFINFISKEKQNPLDRALVILPSVRLQNSLSKALARKSGFISAVDFADFQNLAASLNAYSTDKANALLPANALQDFIIKDILNKYSSLPASRGYRTLFKSAFRDLIAAEITVKDLLLLMESDEIPSQEQKKQLSEFIVCYDQYLRQIRKDGFDSYGDFFKKAAGTVKNNAYLKKFKYIIFYGFYDLTALQYNVFKEIAADFEVSVYFPYLDTPAYSFVKNFYEGSILPLAQYKEALPPDNSPFRQAACDIFLPSDNEAQNPDIRIIGVSGVRDEVNAAAKEILTLKEKHHIAFGEIALFARTMDPYKYDIPAIFARNKIPVNYSFEFPLLSHPFAAYIYNLLNLGRNDFYSADAAAVVASPYFKEGRREWRDIIRNSGITGGLSQWSGLANLYINSKNEEEKRLYRANAAQITQTIQALANFYPTLEEAGDFEFLAEKANSFIEAFTREDIEDYERNILEKIRKIIRQTASFSQVRRRAQKGEFLDELLWAMKEETFAKTSEYSEGVQAADIMALRGQHFKAAVFLGMNEGLLPATPAPDPILKEEYRTLLQKVGFLIHNQNERYFEEKLLFSLALSSVAEKCSFIFERSGDDGKTKIPSLYLSRLAQSAGKNLRRPDLSLSRRESEKLAQWPFELLNQEEAASLAALKFPAAKQALYTAFNPEELPDTLLENQLEKAPFLAFKSPGLNAYDGVIGHSNALAEKINIKGLSPSNLRALWLCPASYMFKNIIRSNEPPEYDRAKIPANAKGTLHHEILQKFYIYVTKNKLLDKLFTGAAGDIFEEFSNSSLTAERYKEYGLYPLVWKDLCKDIKKNLRHLIEADLPVLQENNLTPSFFEYHLEAEADFDGVKLKLHGETDRIDINKETLFCRVVDYKSGKEDSSMLKAIFEKGILQPPLYMLMINESKDKNLQGCKAQSASLLAVEEEGNPEKSFSLSEYEAVRPYFERAVKYRLDLAREGVFLITPCEDTCKYCAFADICRKDHGPSLRRAALSAQAVKLRSFNAPK